MRGWRLWFRVCGDIFLLGWRQWFREFGSISPWGWRHWAETADAEPGGHLGVFVRRLLHLHLCVWVKGLEVVRDLDLRVWVKGLWGY